MPSVLDFLSLLFDNLSYVGIIAFLALCGCGVPIPEEVALVLAGVLSSNGQLDPWLAFGSCIVGALLGDSIMYAIGRHFGHGWLTKHPTIARFIDADKEERFEAAVKQHGFKMLLLTRFLVGVRGPVYYAAGSAKVPYFRFLLWDMVSATLVVGIVFWLAFKFGSGITKLVRVSEITLTVLVLGLALAGAFFLYKQQTKRMAAALEDLTEKGEAEGGDATPAGSATDDGPTSLADAADSGLGHGSFAHGGLNGHEAGERKDADALAESPRKPE
ncbi:MAG: DedA family protein [Lacipirellulaceae bacterium]